MWGITMAKDEIVKVDVNTFDVISRKTVLTEYEEKTIEEIRRVHDPIDIWLIGNTGMRNPWRIPSGFKVYVESNLVGRLRSSEDQVSFKMLLYDKGEIGGDLNKDVDASITRKYRLMFNKYGFAYPEVAKKEGFAQKELGKVDDITPLGKAFYNADSVTAQQECFLRGLIVPMEELGEGKTYSPLLWVLSIMLELEKQTGDTKINFIEFAICVQTTNPSNDIKQVVSDILTIRNERKDAENKQNHSVVR